MNKPFEIIAPAGNIYSLAAAVKAGADAVYFGFKGQNARGRAENFDTENLLKAIAYLRKKNIKSYITLNTVLTDNDLPLLEKRLNTLSLSPPDAIIIQDLAVLELGRKILPQSVKFHASTQMGICNSDGVRFAEQCGLSQVVLARELSFEEIENIAKNTRLKLEVFVLGAMCYSCSGFCYASLIEQKRSGNRGVCAQICRHNFKKDYPFSMKDLNLMEEIPKLVKAGVRSFKIEGRMKGADYVYTTVSALKELQNELNDKGIKKAKKILENYPFFRETGKGYFYFPEKKKIFTSKKHSVQLLAGKVKEISGKTLILEHTFSPLKKGARIKINGNGATILSVSGNKIILSRKLLAKTGDKVEIYPNKDEIKGLKGMVNQIENIKIPIEISLTVTVEKNKITLAIKRKKTIIKIEMEVECEVAKTSPLTDEILLKHLKSPYYQIVELKINKNNFAFKPSVFKEIKKRLKENAESMLYNALNASPQIHKTYPKLEFIQTNTKKCRNLPPVYYNPIQLRENCIIVNNVGQLTLNADKKITGKFLPVCNKAAAYFLKEKFKVSGFQKPYELNPKKETPYFTVRVKPEKLPDNFTVEKWGEIFLIKKKT